MPPLAPLLVAVSVLAGANVRWLERPTTQPPLRTEGLTAEAAARRHLRAGPDVVLEHVHDVGAGAIVVNFRAVHDGVPVFLHRVSVVMDRQYRAVAVFGGLPAFAPATLTFALSAEDALTVAGRDQLGLALPWRALPARDGDGFWTSALAGGRTRRVAFVRDGRPEPAWYVEVTGDRAFAYVVSAQDGVVLFRQDLDRDFSYRVWADPGGIHQPHDGPQGTAASPHPTGKPDGWSAMWTAPSLVTLDRGPISTNDPWLPPGAASTLGNNVDAYADLVAPDGYGNGDVRPSADGGTFGGSGYDVAAAPTSRAQQEAAATQAFYTLNFLHDWFYDVGFNEAAGNAQNDNLGRGGKAGDRLLAETQDSLARNNAFMRTPADGASPRLTIGVYDANARAVLSQVTPTARDFTTEIAQFGPTAFDRTGDLVAVTDGTAPTGDGCQPPYATPVAGKIALFDRGLCPFTAKVAYAQDAGAVGVVIANNVAGAPLPIAGVDGQLTLPVLSIGQADGATLRTAAGAGPVTVRMLRENPVDHDGALDNGVVAHEWFHHVSNRLVGDGSGLYLSQAWAMGEGWSDFAALLFELRASDANVASNANWGGAYVMGGYARQGLIADVWYYSSRRLPYSADFAKNALTFKHISANEPLPAGVPTRFGQDGSDNIRPHTAGEVWGTMLWECMVALLRDTPRLTYDEALLRMRRYLIASLKATPMAPTFLEARDALLAVAYASDPADHLLFAKAFARRGAGLRAVAPPRTAADHRPLTEDFTTGSDLAFVDATVADDLSACDDDGTLDRGEAGAVVVRFRNSGTARLTATTLTLEAKDGGVQVLDAAPLKLPASDPQQVVEAKVRVQLEPSVAGETLELKVSASDPGLTIPGAVAATVTLPINRDAVAGAFDDVEVPSVAWTFTADAGTAAFKRVADDPTRHYFRGPVADGQTDFALVSPPLAVGSGPLQVTFRHRHQFLAQGGEAYEGGVVELSTDDGKTWTDVGASAMPGYGGAINTGGGKNVLEGRMAFIGVSANYPAWVPVTLDLGTSRAGQTVRLRFRLATNDGGANIGWDLDDFSFTGLTNAPFQRLQPEPDTCVQHRPLAVAEAVAEAKPDEMVTLDGSKSSDLDGDPLTFTWKQVAGQTVQVANASGPKAGFLAPRTMGVTLEFELVVRDGKADSVPAKVAVKIAADTGQPKQGCGCGAGAGGLWLILAAGLLGRTVPHTWRRRRQGP